MHRYQPRIHVNLVADNLSATELERYSISKTFTFAETSFMV